ncbi:MAG TPA: histidine kinase dimerization/phospho-acceptor domain-containing protein, partial [archaeon]|nr:histidine kinase dimerization/phospho-acceptor domain-containing protein [archaeon]
AIIDNLPVAIVVLDSDNKILLANRMAGKFAGRPPKDLPGFHVGEAFQCIHAQDDPEGCGYGPSCSSCIVGKTIDNTFKTDKACSMIEGAVEFEGQGKKIVRLSAEYLEQNASVILALEDITGLKKQEEERFEKNELLSALETVRSICHEMNQPLQVISGYLELMLMKSSKSEPYYEFLVRLKEQSDRLADISRKLMSIHSDQTKENL